MRKSLQEPKWPQVSFSVAVYFLVLPRECGVNHACRYHKQHGHQNQQLHENGDGTFSIVNPETSTPYPGETGMEKEKPHKCEYCHKRYKNLNGLKYVSTSTRYIRNHEVHSTDHLHSTNNIHRHVKSRPKQQASEQIYPITRWPLM